MRPTCAGANAMRNAIDGVVFTATEAGVVSISIGEGAVVGVKRGARCDGPELGCLTAEDQALEVEVAEGEKLTLLVQTSTGPAPYNLTLE